MRTITIEEHFVTHDFLKATGQDSANVPPQIAALRPKLLDIGTNRIADMDDSGIDYQVLSLSSMGMDALNAVTATALAHDINDELAATVSAYPHRFGGFATLGLKEPEKAANELERCVSKLGFRGAMLDGTTNGLFLDDERFLPVFQTASRLDVPIYLHPAPPTDAVREAYYTGLPGMLGNILSIAGWGWHAETGLHTLRLIVTGLFDKLPNLNLIIGHMGEGLPYAMDRTSGILSNVGANLRQPVADYFKTNIHLTTSGYFSQPPLKCATEVVGIDRLIFSIDYPYSSNQRGRVFLDGLDGPLSKEDLKRFAHGNAEKLLRLPTAK